PLRRIGRRLPGAGDGGPGGLPRGRADREPARRGGGDRRGPGGLPGGARGRRGRSAGGGGRGGCGGRGGGCWGGGGPRGFPRRWPVPTRAGKILPFHLARETGGRVPP